MSRIWCNGKLSDETVALDPHDRGLTLGDGLFETMLVVNRTALWLDAHLTRFQASAVELAMAFDRHAAESAIEALLASAPDSHQALRLTLTRGPGARGLAGSGIRPSLIATLDAFERRLMFEPARLVTSSIRRNATSPATRHKTLSYMDNILAAREADAANAEDALLLGNDGHAVCTTIANIFMIRGKRLVTPSLDQPVLPGTMRRAILSLAPSLGFSVEERPVLYRELVTADSVFLSNSLRLIRPVSVIDGVAISFTAHTQLIDALCHEAKSQCGCDPRLE